MHLHAPRDAPAHVSSFLMPVVMEWLMIKGQSTAFAAIALMMSCQLAVAGPFQSPQGFYLGMDYMRINGAEIQRDGGAVFGGYRFNRWVGVEVGTQIFRYQGIVFNNSYLAGISYLPVYKNQWSLFGAAGGATVTGSREVNGTTISASRSKFWYGGGIEGRLSNHWTFRAGYYPDDDIINTGISYRF